MNPPKSNTALILFSRSARAESRIKTLSDQQVSNRQVIRFLNKKTQVTLQSTNLPIYCFDENNQVGSSFGERLSNAFQEVFDRGYEKIIVIGSDCPELDKKDIFQAACLLTKNKAVLGPDERNGAYLIGLHSSQFDQNSFSKLLWQTNQTIDSLKDYFGSCFLLEEKTDLNSQYDLKRFVRLAKSAWIGKAIRKIIGLFNSFSFVHRKRLYPAGTPVSFELRGPPFS